MFISPICNSSIVVSFFLMAICSVLLQVIDLSRFLLPHFYSRSCNLPAEWAISIVSDAYPTLLMLCPSIINPGNISSSLSIVSLQTLNKFLSQATLYLLYSYSIHFTTECKRLSTSMSYSILRNTSSVPGYSYRYLRRALANSLLNLYGALWYYSIQGNCISSCLWQNRLFLSYFQ